MKWLGHYRCERCGHEFRERASWEVSCPNCGHLRLVWLNYDALRASNGRADTLSMEEPDGRSDVERERQARRA